MPGIPNAIYSVLRRTLLSDCGSAFATDATLRAVFANALLSPWQNSLPNADNRMARVDLTIDFLKDKHRADTRANALVLFLRVLADQTDSEDECYAKLSDVAEQLAAALAAPAVTHLQRRQLEANPENQQMIYTTEYEQLLASVQAVCRVSVPKIVKQRITEEVSTGTGWLMAPTLLLTCFHVVQARDTLFADPLTEADLAAQVAESMLTFDYTQAGHGVEYRVSEHLCHDSTLDYSVLRLENRPDHPLEMRGFLALDVHAPFTAQTRVFIIQHPKGQPQQISAGRFARLGARPFNLLHSAPTEPGTSGAPVLNVTNWRVVAVHDGEDEQADLRVATLIGPILDDLAHQCPDVYQMILEAQQLVP